jgi:hypothetical protein
MRYNRQNRSGGPLVFANVVSRCSVFGTRGEETGRAGRRHELRRYRKSLVGCSPCRAAPERLYSYIRALLLFIILIFAPVFNEREEERVREPCPLRHSSRVAYHTPVKASRTRPLSTGKAVHTARATAHTPRRATLARGSHPRGRAAAQARADAPTRSLQLALYRAYMCNYKHGIH